MMNGADTFRRAFRRVPSFPAVLLLVVGVLCLPGSAIARQNDGTSPIEELPGRAEEVITFPPLPPPPEGAEIVALPPVEEELWHHGGSYLYQAEGDRLGWPDESCGDHFQVLRLPECWEEPRPVTAFQEFLGADPIAPPSRTWFGPCGYAWEPRFVGYGGYEVFGIALEQGNQRQDLVGHQLLVDLDLSITGTERLHVQFRPIGERNTGGSYYQFTDDDGYVDNSTGIPDRWWIEGEVDSIFGGFLNPFAVRDVHVVAGQFPMLLQNGLLLNDDITGFVVNKNTATLGTLSNLNIQGFFGIDHVDAFPGVASDVYGAHILADYRLAFIEATYAHLDHSRDSGRDSDYVSLAATQFFGRLSLTGRALLKWGDENGRGAGQLFVIESNFASVPSRGFTKSTGIEHTVTYVNAFRANDGWNSISGGNFNRLRQTFAVNPLVAISASPSPDDTTGVALGTQLFRRHDDESIIPEIAYEAPGGTSVFGTGITYLRKVGPRQFVEVQGVLSFSDDAAFRREGLFTGLTTLF